MTTQVETMLNTEHQSTIPTNDMQVESYTVEYNRISTVQDRVDRIAETLARHASQFHKFHTRLVGIQWLLRASSAGPSVPSRATRSASDMTKAAERLSYKVGVEGEAALRCVFDLDDIRGDENVKTVRKIAVRRTLAAVAFSERLRKNIQHFVERLTALSDRLSAMSIEAGAEAETLSGAEVEMQNASDSASDMETASSDDDSVMDVEPLFAQELQQQQQDEEEEEDDDEEDDEEEQQEEEQIQYGGDLFSVLRGLMGGQQQATRRQSPKRQTETSLEQQRKDLYLRRLNEQRRQYELQREREEQEYMRQQALRQELLRRQQRQRQLELAERQRRQEEYEQRQRMEFARRYREQQQMAELQRRQRLASRCGHPFYDCADEEEDYFVQRRPQARPVRRTYSPFPTSFFF